MGINWYISDHYVSVINHLQALLDDIIQNIHFGIFIAVIFFSPPFNEIKYQGNHMLFCYLIQK